MSDSDRAMIAMCFGATWAHCGLKRGYRIGGYVVMAIGLISSFVV